jgi:SAM-dependent methyltransferase
MSMLAGACRGSGSPGALAWLAESLRLAPDLALLDVGAGLAGPSAWAAQRYGVRPIPVEPMVEACRGGRDLFGLPGVVASADALPLRSASFEVAWVLGVLDTVRDPVAVLREVRRALTDHGRLGVLAYVATRPVEDRRTPDGNTFSSAGDLDAHLDAAGFVVVDRADDATLPAVPLDWQLRQDRLDRELDGRHGHDPRWTESKRQEGAFARLIDDGSVAPLLLHAVCR